METKKRCVFLDEVKGISIILIVLGHIILLNNPNGNWLCTYIYTFHVPIFFIISGILYSMRAVDFSKIEKKEFVKKKINKLLYPYFTFSILTILYLIIEAIITKNSMTSVIKILINTVCLFGYGPAWFLPVLCLSEIIYYLINRIKIRNSLKKVLIIIIFIWIIIFSRILQYEFWEKNLIIEFIKKFLNLITRFFYRIWIYIIW